ncbi:MAG TPA: Hsp20/alpha crystallin family protein [Myxococcota bacterium]|nr:Hsp20/alpha crystallin family protein [Myxococcota bacterium]
MSNQSEARDLEVREKQISESEGTRPGPVFQPEVDILERAEGYLVYADLPGVDEKSVSVKLESGTLILDAELATTPDPAWRPLLEEYRFGSYHREFRISEGIDTARVSASLRDGVLELELPKAESRRARTVAVQAG